MTSVSYSPRLDVVVDVVTRALDRWPADAARIERGAALLIRGHVAPLTPTSWAVRSSTDAGVVYAVTLTACTCRDTRPACQHRWACDLLVIATERQRRLDRAAGAQASRARFSAESCLPQHRFAALRRVAIAYARAVGFGGR